MCSNHSGNGTRIFHIPEMALQQCGDWRPIIFSLPFLTNGGCCRTESSFHTSQSVQFGRHDIWEHLGKGCHNLTKIEKYAHMQIDIYTGEIQTEIFFQRVFKDREVNATCCNFPLF